jgi:hypothetical protein
MRIDITVPHEWLPALKRLAEERGVSLSRLLSEAATKLLPPDERKKLPKARGRGRPAKSE